MSVSEGNMLAYSTKTNDDHESLIHDITGKVVKEMAMIEVKNVTKALEL